MDGVVEGKGGGRKITAYPAFHGESIHFLKLNGGDRGNLSRAGVKLLAAHHHLGYDGAIGANISKDQ